MPIESATTLAQLDATLPLSGDGMNQAGAHLRQLKSVFKNVFKGNLGAGYALPAVRATEDEIDLLVGVQGNIQARLDAVTSRAVPLLGIVAYHGLFSAIPAGWQLCDGTNGTPNLSDVFLYGTITENQIGQGGGSADTILKSHNHNYTHNHVVNLTVSPAHSHTYALGNASSGAGSVLAQTNLSANQNLNTSSNGLHTHTFNVNQATVTTGSAGGVATNTNNPAYIRSAFIARVS